MVMFPVQYICQNQIYDLNMSKRSTRLSLVNSLLFLNSCQISHFIECQFIYITLNLLIKHSERDDDMKPQFGLKEKQNYF